MEVDFKNFLPQVPECDYGFKEQSQKYTVSMFLRDWDQDCRVDMVSGKGFYVTEEPYADNYKQKKNFNGIMSERFCTDWSDEGAFQERYKCHCGDLYGKAHENEICPKCSTKVEYKDVDYKMFAWIQLNGLSIIQPSYYYLLASFLTEPALKEMLEIQFSTDLSGNISDGYTQREVDPDIAIQPSTLMEEDEKKKAGNKPKSPFKGIGLIEFKERFKEIIRWGMKVKKDKKELGMLLLDNEEQVFCSNIPVYTSILRPESVKNEVYNYYDINTIYNTIFSLTRVLYGCYVTSKLERERLDAVSALSRIQTKVCLLYQSIFDIIKGKEGFINQQIIGGRLSWSSRCVIIPDSTLHADQVILPYLAFLEMYKFEIIGYIAEINQVSEAKAFYLWNMAKLKFDEKVHQIMKFIIKKHQPMVIINRNPTINYGSLLPVYVKDVTDSIDNLCMSLPISILRNLNADFDGDVLNIYSLKTERFKREFDKHFNPRKNHYVSRTTGLFDPAVSLLKDQAIGLYDFNNI